MILSQITPFARRVWRIARTEISALAALFVVAGRLSAIVDRMMSPCRTTPPPLETGPSSGSSRPHRSAGFASTHFLSPGEDGAFFSGPIVSRLARGCLRADQFGPQAASSGPDPGRAQDD